VLGDLNPGWYRLRGKKMQGVKSGCFVLISTNALTQGFIKWSVTWKYHWYVSNRWWIVGKFFEHQLSISPHVPLQPVLLYLNIKISGNGTYDTVTLVELFMCLNWNCI
jgi:hypothetical protein